MGDEWFEDPTRLLRGELSVDDTARQAITAAAELIWDDLLDSVETDTVTDALLIGLLPRQFRDRTASDWRRWLATFITVVWKLGQPAPPPDAPRRARALFEAVVRDNLDLGRPHEVELIFSGRPVRRGRPRTQPETFKTKIVTRGVDVAGDVFYKHSRIERTDACTISNFSVKQADGTLVRG